MRTSKTHFSILAQSPPEIPAGCSFPASAESTEQQFSYSIRLDRDVRRVNWNVVLKHLGQIELC